jgi:[acyl-carrier-protein] S-malonyltransferase
LRDYLANIQFQVPEIAVINNVDVAVVNDPVAIKDALVRQAASPVRWVETVQKMASNGISHIIECGPGKVLAGLTKRINGDLAGEAIIDQASLESVLGKLK